jgi:hypothetical protein
MQLEVPAPGVVDALEAFGEITTLLCTSETPTTFEYYLRSG